MKTNKRILFAVIAICVIACTFAFAACTPDEVDDGVNAAVSLASQCNTTSVKLVKDGKTYYSYEKSGDSGAVISDPYDTGVLAEQYVDFAKKIQSSVSSSDIKVSSKTYNADNGDVKLTATFNNAENSLGVKATDAVLKIEGNVKTNSVKVYMVTYTDANGYTVEISLSK